VTKTQEGSNRFPRFLPDGRHFLFTVRGQAEQPGIYAGSLDGETQKLLPGIDSSALYAAGYLLYLDGNTLVGRAFDADRLELKDQPFAVAERVGHSSTGYGRLACVPIVRLQLVPSQPLQADGILANHSMPAIADGKVLWPTQILAVTCRMA